MPSAKVMKVLTYSHLEHTDCRTLLYILSKQSKILRNIWQKVVVLVKINASSSNIFKRIYVVDELNSKLSDHHVCVPVSNGFKDMTYTWRKFLISGSQGITASSARPAISSSSANSEKHTVSSLRHRAPFFSGRTWAGWQISVWPLAGLLKRSRNP